MFYNFLEPNPTFYEKKCIFCKSVKAIYIYESESSYYRLSKNDMVYRRSEPPSLRYYQLKY